MEDGAVMNEFIPEQLPASSFQGLGHNVEMPNSPMQSESWPVPPPSYPEADNVASPGVSFGHGLHGSMGMGWPGANELEAYSEGTFAHHMDNMADYGATVGSQAYNVAPSVASSEHGAGGLYAMPNSANLEQRAFIRTSERRPGLETGDVVMLLQQGRPFMVVQSQLPSSEQPVQYVLEVAAEVSPEQEGRCYLEVVQQGGFIGFRANAAGQRFMQPRRKAPHRLVFFNLNFGVWEQWEVESGDWHYPWSQVPLLLRSRRLPHVQLHVEMVRVGMYVAAGGGGPGAATPRSLMPAPPLAMGAMPSMGALRQQYLQQQQLPTAPPSLASGPGSVFGGGMSMAMGADGWFGGLRASAVGAGPSGGGAAAGGGSVVEAVPAPFLLGALGEDENLRRISGLLVQEWFRFVDIEKTQRLQVEADVAQLVEELGELKMSTISQVEFLRSEMNAEILSLFGVVRAREAQLAALRAARKRALEVAVGALWRRRGQEALQALMDAWRDAVVRRIARRTSIKRQQARAARKILSASFDAWYAVTLAQLARSNLLVRAVGALCRRRMAAAVSAWREITLCRLEGRRALESLAQRAQQQHLALALAAWRQGAQLQRLERRSSARAAEAALAAWQAAAAKKKALQGLYERASRLVGPRRRVLAGWRQAVCQARERAAEAEQLRCRHEQQRAQEVLDGWAAAAHQRRALEHTLQRHAARRRLALLAAVMRAWSGRCAATAAAAELLEAAACRWRRRLVWAALREWLWLARSSNEQRFFAIYRLRRDTRALLATGIGALWVPAAAAVAAGLPLMSPAVSRLGGAADTPGSSGGKRRRRRHKKKGGALGAASPAQGSPALADGGAAGGAAGLGAGAGVVKNIAELLGAEDDEDEDVGEEGLAGPGTPLPAGCVTLVLEQGSSMVPQSAALLWAALPAQRLSWLLMASLHAWRAVVKESKAAAEQQLLRHAVHAERRAAARVFSAWRQHVEVAKDVRAAVNGLFHHSLTVLQARVLQGWWEVAQQRRARARLLARHLACGRSLQLHACFAGWRREAQALKAARARADALAARSNTSLASIAFDAWCDAVAGRKAQSAQLRHAAAIITRSRLRMAFRAWTAAAAHTAEQEAAAAEAVRAVRLRHALACWAEHAFGAADGRRTLARREAKACVWRSQRLRACAFTAWSDWAAHARHTRIKVARLLMRTTTATVADAFHAWVAAARRSRALRARAGKLLSSRSHRSVASAFASWRAVCEDASHARLRAEVMAADVTVRRLSAAFVGWLEAVEARRRGRRALATLGRGLAAHGLKAALRGWLEVTDAMVCARQKAESLAASRTTRALSRAFRALLANADEAAACQAAAVLHVTRAARRRLRTLVHAWADVAGAAVRRQELLEFALARRTAHVAGAVLRTWAMVGAVMHAQRVTVARFEVRHRQRCVGAALRAWRGTVLEQQRQREQLKACIKRKKVAFQLFKQWYWDAFDSDVQDTIRRMFYTTEAAVHSPVPSGRPTNDSPRPNLNLNPQQQQQLAALAAGRSWLQQSLDGGYASHSSPAAQVQALNEYHLQQLQQQQHTPAGAAAAAAAAAAARMGASGLGAADGGGSSSNSTPHQSGATAAGAQQQLLAAQQQRLQQVRAVSGIPKPPTSAWAQSLLSPREYHVVNRAGRSSRSSAGSSRAYVPGAAGAADGAAGDASRKGPPSEGAAGAAGSNSSLRSWMMAAEMEALKAAGVDPGSAAASAAAAAAAAAGMRLSAGAPAAAGSAPGAAAALRQGSSGGGSAPSPLPGAGMSWRQVAENALFDANKPATLVDAGGSQAASQQPQMRPLVMDGAVPVTTAPSVTSVISEVFADAAAGAGAGRGSNGGAARFALPAYTNTLYVHEGEEEMLTPPPFQTVMVMDGAAGHNGGDAAAVHMQQHFHMQQQLLFQQQQQQLPLASSAFRGEVSALIGSRLTVGEATVSRAASAAATAMLQHAAAQQLQSLGSAALRGAIRDDAAESDSDSS